MRLTFADKANREDWSWWSPWEAADSVLAFGWAQVPYRSTQALLLAVLVGASLVITSANLGATGPTARMWRIDNPFLIVSLAYLVGYFVFPISMSGVAGFSNRFVYLSELAFIFAWNLPGKRVIRGVVVALALCFSAFCLDDIAQRFRAFQGDTRGASALMDLVGPRETLYYYAGADGGFSPAFGVPNKAMIELELFASARRGGLPNTSFAGYGYTYVRLVHGNPMPGIHTPPSWSQEMTKFDYVLVRGEHALSDRRFRLVDSKYGWELYGVCGSHRFSTCG
jgi:hypothetical protein